MSNTVEIHTCCISVSKCCVMVELFTNPEFTNSGSDTAGGGERTSLFTKSGGQGLLMEGEERA